MKSHIIIQFKEKHGKKEGSACHNLNCFVSLKQNSAPDWQDLMIILIDMVMLIVGRYWISPGFGRETCAVTCTWACLLPQHGDEVQIQISEHECIFSLVWQNGNWNLQNLLGEQFHSCSHFYKLYCILQRDTKSGDLQEEGIDVTLQRSPWMRLTVVWWRFQPDTQYAHSHMHMGGGQGGWRGGVK